MGFSANHCHFVRFLPIGGNISNCDSWPYQYFSNGSPFSPPKNNRNHRFKASCFLLKFSGNCNRLVIMIYGTQEVLFLCHPRFVILIIFNFWMCSLGVGVLDVCSPLFPHKHSQELVCEFRFQQIFSSGRWKKAWDPGKVIHNIWKTVGVKDTGN